MSLPSKKTIACPQCNASFTTTIFDSVNTDYDKELAKKIISGEFFDAKCPKCGFVAHLEYDVLYHDMKHNAMIFVVHKANENYKSRIAEIQSMFTLPGYTTRIVHDMSELREKAAALEMNRDDREIELCKYYMMMEAIRQRPDFKAVRAFYTCSGNQETVFVYDENNSSLACILEDNMIALIQTVFGAALSEMQEEKYPIYDAAWAEQFWATQDADDLDDEDVVCDNGEEAELLEQRKVRFKGVLERAFLSLMEETGSPSCGNGIYIYQIETKTGILEVRVAYENIEQALVAENLEILQDKLAANTVDALIKKRIEYLIALRHIQPENYVEYEIEQSTIKAQRALVASEDDKASFERMADEAGMTAFQYEKFLCLKLENDGLLYLQKRGMRNRRRQENVMRQMPTHKGIHFDSFEAFLNAYRKN